MKQHAVDYFSLVFGLAFAALAVLTLSGQRWAIEGTWASGWIGPIFLIALGLAVLAPRRKREIEAPGDDIAMEAALSELPPEVPLDN